ncbi:hypothetical protein [Allomuricauda sp. F6463D]|uniref:hypothetical protein n=1 Tax=Allomuricauda sp. F6463D TaxID=2926409 RepID=UPI001FF3BD7D|nr:hypothetical protein [Muricauda sp. F6463D]MCK0159681.1 hypothetical protein [Muricauda sp. F6463D]
MKETLAKLDQLMVQLHQMNAPDCEDLDEIVTINEKMRRMIENVRSVTAFDDLVNSFDQNNHKMNFSVSNDGNFGVFSWHSKMDCLGIHIKNIALYKTDGRIVASSLYGEPMAYYKITSMNLNKHKTIYLLKGSSSIKASDSILKTYTITNGDLVESRISLQ